MIHKLKTWPVYFNEVLNGNKPFEVRKNDRAFGVNDEVLLEEWYPENDEEPNQEGCYSGRIIHSRISYILYGGQFGIEKGFIVMGLAQI